MVEGLLLLMLHRPAQMRELLKVALAGPILVVLCYEVGDNLAPASTVAIVALLVAAAYGAALILTTARIAMSLAADASTRKAILALQPTKTSTARRTARRKPTAQRPPTIKAA